MSSGEHSSLHLPSLLPSQDKTLDFYEQFHVIVLGLDSLEARRYMNSVACSFLGALRGFIVSPCCLLGAPAAT
jgi:ubiquitin-activating enzyme E1 C